MNLSLEGKRALVCGSTQGIGLATAIELAELGAELTLFARNEEKLRELTETLPKNHGQNHSYIQADFSKPEEVETAVSDFLKKEKSFHILINNTGGPAGGPAEKAALDEFRNAFEQHLINNQILVKALVPFMKEESYGRIINIISTSVKIPIPNLGVSNTIRGAVANWSKTLASELGGFGITVNNVLPGMTKTARLSAIVSNRSASQGIAESDVEKTFLGTIPAARFGESHEIGAAAAFLCTPAAAYINGINLPVDGGRTKSL